GAAIPNALDFIINGHAVIARAQEIGMQGVTEAIFDGPAGRHQGLPQNLPPEYMRKAQILAVALKMIVSDRGKIQQLHQFSGYIQHARSCRLLAHERVFTPDRKVSQRLKLPKTTNGCQPSSLAATGFRPGE